MRTKRCNHLQSQSLVFNLRGFQLFLLVSELFLCFLTGAPQTFHLVSRVHSFLTVFQKRFLQRKLLLLIKPALSLMACSCHEVGLTESVILICYLQADVS